MRTLILGLAVFGCVGCGSSAAPFVGSWLVTTTDGTNACSSFSFDITGTQDTFTLALVDGELVRDGGKLRLVVDGDHASLTAPGESDFSVFQNFHFSRFDLQTSDGQLLTDTVVGTYDSMPTDCSITAHLSGHRTQQ